jgi:3-methyladenine DNA glycosylase AlkD
MTAATTEATGSTATPTATRAAPTPISTSEVTARAVAFVAEHKPVAEALGAALADHIGDPDAFANVLRAGLQGLSDPEYLAGQQRIAPGIGAIHGVRWPLLAAASRTFKQATRQDRATPLLFVADRLFHEPELEPRWFAFGLLERTLETETERTWQLLRRAARESGDWITVDSLAHPYGKGIAAETYRWAELEQLVYSPSRWERRLVGSTIATMTAVDRRRGRESEVAAHALPLLAQLMGDAEPDVQKALSWAYRSLTVVDMRATIEALQHEAERAARTDDGHRAWVVRDTLAKLDPTVADALRERLTGIRKRAGAPSTSEASLAALRFGGLPDPITHPEPPLA